MATSSVITAAPAISVEEVAPGINLEWLSNKHIVVFQFTTNSRDSIDICWIRIKQIMEDWPGEKSYLAMQDFSGPKASLTPYIRERSKEVMDWRPDLKGYIALVVPRTILAQLVSFFLRAQKPHHRQVQMFFSREDGLRWLRSKL